jgi:hypothetical protein
VLLRLGTKCERCAKKEFHAGLRACNLVISSYRFASAQRVALARGESKMRQVTLLVGCAVGGVVALGTAAHAAVVFSDGTFATSGWVNETINVGSGGTVGVSQVSTGNPGFARRVTITLGSQAGDTTFSFNRYGNTTATRYEPATSGAITSIDWGIDARFVTGSLFGEGQAIMLGLRQGNVNYVADYDVTGSGGQWNTFGATSLVVGDFTRLDGVAGSPDFSATAAPIRFGFVTGNSTTGGSYFTTVDYDNWFVRVVPTPGSLALAGLGGLMMVRRRRA